MKVSEREGPAERIVPANYRDALRGIADPQFLRTPKYREQQWRADRNGLDPQLLLFERMLVRRALQAGIPLFCSEAIRSAKRQQELFVKGFSKLTAGPHMKGMAVDIIHSVRAWEMDRKQWDLIGHIGKDIIQSEGLEIRWGGDWTTFWDPAHWEREDWHNVPSPLHPV